MSIDLLLYYTRPEVRYWTLAEAIVIIAVVFIATKLTKNQFLNYRKQIENKSIQAVLVFIHMAGSFILAVILPNNFLQDYSVFKNLYSANGMWIFVSILLLFFIFMVGIGYFLNLICYFIFTKRKNY